MYLKNVFPNHIFNIYVKAGFGITLATTVDMPENQTKPNQSQTQPLFLLFTEFMESVTRVQNLNKAVCVSLRANAL